MSKTVLFQTIQFSLIRCLNVWRVPSQTIQFSTGTQFSSIGPIDRTLSGATTLGHGRPWSDGIKRLISIPQIFCISEASPSDCLVSYAGHALSSLTPLQRCSWCILQPQPTGQVCVYNVFISYNKLLSEECVVFSFFTL